MSVLVLGGAGYIGSHTVYELVENGADVVVADNLSTGHIESLKKGIKFYKGDIHDEMFLDNIFKNENIDCIIHFAAFSLVGESMKDPLKYYANNLGGTMSLLKSMVKNNVLNLIFSSTAAVYGEPEDIPIEENSPTIPTNAYGETKLAMERMMNWANKAYGINYAALRYFNACGAHVSGEIGEDHFPETHLIPLVLQVPIGKRPYISIFGNDYNTKDGTCIRDYIHVTDLAKAHILAMDYILNGGKSGSFNLGNGVGFSVEEIIEAARRVTGVDIEAKYDKRRPGDPAKLVASSQKAKNILGWKPEFTDIDSIIKTAWKWHSSHPYGFKSDNQS